ncbi:MAG: BON domain-containing protein [Gemmataceae bacterium]
MITGSHTECDRPCAEPAPGRDDHLVSTALARLRSSGYPLLAKLRCEVADGVVTVFGSVPTFHLKQMAQAVLIKSGSFRAVKNAVEVR